MKLEWKNKGQIIEQQLAQIGANEVSLAEKSKKLLDTITKLSGFDVGMKQIGMVLSDFAKELTEVSEENLAIMEETTANMSEANRYIGKTTAALEKLESEAEKLSQQNMESRKLLDEVYSIKENVIEDTKKMHEQISELVNLTAEVGKIVVSVQGIASQTNLLALNASIEAARAGEHGRGFAVVAEEVRGLADSTRENLAGMTEVVKDIGIAASAGKESLDCSMESIMDMGDKIDIVIKNIGGNMEMLEEVTDRVDVIHQSMQGIRQSASDISDAMDGNSVSAERLNEMTSIIREEAEQTVSFSGQLLDIDDELSNFSKEMYTQLLKTKRSVSNEELCEMLEKAKKAHGAWLVTMKKIVDKMKIYPIQTNANKCAFGHFYYVIDVNHESIASDWKKIGELHKKFHSFGDTVIEAVRKQDTDGAARGYKEALDLSKELLGALDTVKNIATQMSKNGERVF